MKALGAQGCVDFEEIAASGNESGGVALDGGQDHGGVRIDETGGQSSGDPTAFHLVYDGRFLTQLVFLFVGISISVGIVGRSGIEVSELIKLEPVHHSVPIIVLITGDIVSNDLSGRFDFYAYLAAGNSGRSRLPDSIDSPISEMISVDGTVKVDRGKG